MPDLKHVLFVCTGNTCRSPMAEGLFRKAVEGRDDFEVSSAGVAASKGTPCNPETAALLKKRGVNLENFGSRQVSETILSKATHVFAMTLGHLQTLEARFPHHSDKFYLVCEFAETRREAGSARTCPTPSAWAAALTRRWRTPSMSRFRRSSPTSTRRGNRRNRPRIRSSRVSFSPLRKSFPDSRRDPRRARRGRRRCRRWS